jgi:hypothetical protein
MSQGGRRSSPRRLPLARKNFTPMRNDTEKWALNNRRRPTPPAQAPTAAMGRIATDPALLLSEVGFDRLQTHEM